MENWRLPWKNEWVYTSPSGEVENGLEVYFGLLDTLRLHLAEPLVRVAHPFIDRIEQRVWTNLPIIPMHDERN